jgi:hypothetical protein
MMIAATYVIKADIEGWAQAKGITPDAAEEEIFGYLTTIEFVGGQTFLALDSVTVMEDTL